MKPILYVNGCSNTAGSELTLPGQHIRESDLELTFSKILADRWNMELKNDAIPGQGNEAIYSQTVHSILHLLKTHDAKDIFALIGFSGINRKNFIYHDHWTKLCTGMSSDSGSIVENAVESWILNSDKSYDLNYFSTIYIGLVKFFEKYNIKYCFFSSSFGEINYPLENVLHENNEVNFSLFTHMKTNKNWFGPLDKKKDFHGYLINAGFEIQSPMGHHSHLAHIEWANVLEDFILSNNLMPVPTPSVLVSWGEVIDKITILEIKLEKIKNDIANQNIKKELQYLNESVHPSVLLVTESLKKDLKDINLKLWQIEDSIRDKEATKEFDETFIELARSVYKVNDARAELKKQINIKLSSDLVEEKSYAKF